MTSTLALTALLMGLAGGPHCIAMCGAACGGIARAPAAAGGVHSVAAGSALFQAGRLTGYALAGAAADRWGPRPVLIAGILILALGTALTPLFTSAWGLMFTIGLLSAMGAGAGSFSVLIGAAAQRMIGRFRQQLPTVGRRGSASRAGGGGTLDSSVRGRGSISHEKRGYVSEKRSASSGISMPPGTIFT